MNRMDIVMINAPLSMDSDCYLIALAWPAYRRKTSELSDPNFYLNINSLIYHRKNNWPLCINANSMCKIDAISDLNNKIIYLDYLFSCPILMWFYKELDESTKLGLMNTKILYFFLFSLLKTCWISFTWTLIICNLWIVALPSLI